MGLLNVSVCCLLRPKFNLISTGLILLQPPYNQHVYSSQDICKHKNWLKKKQKQIASYKNVDVLSNVALFYMDMYLSGWKSLNNAKICGALEWLPFTQT